MNNLATRLAYTDVRITKWLARYGLGLLRVSMGVIFLWFGGLKFFPDLSSAQDLATRTISVLSFGLVPPSVSIVILAVWECAIGLGLILGRGLRITLLALFVQMIGALAPLVLFPQEVFTHFPYVPTLAGQYIIKNLVLISAGLVLGATVRGGRLVAEPDRVQLSQPVR